MSCLPKRASQWYNLFNDLASVDRRDGRRSRTKRREGMLVDFGFSEEPDPLRETCRQFLEEEAPMQKLRELGEAGR
jgi:hypothetical protein